MQTFKKVLDKFTVLVTSSLMLIMVLVAIWQVFTRYALNSPSTFSEEFLRYSLIWVSMLGAAYVFGKKGHLAVEFLVRKLPRNLNYVVNIIIELVLIAFSATVMVLGGTKAVIMTMGQTSGALGIPVGFVYLSLPLSGVLTIAYSVVNLYKFIKTTKSEKNSEEFGQYSKNLEKTV
jgi:TRAP-type C4-dicarboxylate transport system permease small subunit